MVKLDKLPYSAHGVKIEVQVVHRVEHGSQDLFRQEKMPQVRTGIRLAHRTTTIGIDRIGIIFIARILDRDLSVRGE